MNNKKRWYIIIALAIYLLIVSFPTYLFTKDLDVLYAVELGLRSAYLVFIILFSIFTKMFKTYTGKTKFSNLFLLLPLFFVAFFNLFYQGIIAKTSMSNPLEQVFNPNGNNLLEILTFSCIIVTVVEEELLFRFIIQRNLEIGHKISRIFITSALFTLCHFFAMLYDARGVIVPIELISLAFIYGISVILGFLYEYTNNIVIPITFSLIYSICTEMLYHIPLENAKADYYITVGCFFAGAAIYLFLFYFLMLKKENR